MNDTAIIDGSRGGRDKKNNSPVDHHNRIKVTSYSIWPLLILFWLSSSFWLVFLAFVCWGAPREWSLDLCNWKVSLPMAFGVLVCLGFGFAIYTLHDYGNELSATAARDGVDKSRWHGRIQHGYQNIGKPHRAHVRRTFFGIVSVVGSTVGMLSFYYGDLEASAWLIGVASVVLVLGLNRYWLR